MQCTASSVLCSIALHNILWHCKSTCQSNGNGDGDGEVTVTVIVIVHHILHITARWGTVLCMAGQGSAA